jgi:hypothetical protein
MSKLTGYDKNIFLLKKRLKRQNNRKISYTLGLVGIQKKTED